MRSECILAVGARTSKIDHDLGGHPCILIAQSVAFTVNAVEEKSPKGKPNPANVFAKADADSDEKVTEGELLALRFRPKPKASKPAFNSRRLE